jgi:hypothetical protein
MAQPQSVIEELAQVIRAEAEFHRQEHRRAKAEADRARNRHAGDQDFFAASRPA